jgi:hypothetical protein
VLPNQNTASYEQLPNEQIKKFLIDLQESINDFIRGLEYPADIQYKVCGFDLIEAILRVDKRIHYYKVFHGMDCNGEKIAALFAYWIGKFRPIKITDERFINKDGYNNKINELFAIHYMLSALCGTGRIKLKNEQDGIDLSLNNPFVKRLTYSFRFRNITIDSIIVLVDAITTDSFKPFEQDENL